MMTKIFLFVFLSTFPTCGYAAAKTVSTVKVTPTATFPSTTSSTNNKASLKDSKLKEKDIDRIIKQIFPTENCGKEESHKIQTQSGRRRKKRVVGGQPAKKGQFPWQVALLFKKRHYCGGSIIHQKYIVTGAHCFNPYTSSNPGDWIVRAGDHRLNDKDINEVDAYVENITVHENYKSMWFEGITDTPPKNDIAIVKLRTPLNFSTLHIRPICVLRPHVRFQWGEKCTVSGWGHLQWNGSQPNVMNYAHVPLVSYKDCNIEKAYNGTIHGTALCAGYPQGETDACEYDSGGPLSCMKCNKYYLTGVISWGHQCARPYKYGVYARMQVLTPWLVGKIAKDQFRAG